MESNDAPQDAAPVENEPVDGRLKIETGWDMLPVRLTDDETIVMSKQMAENFAQVTNLENALASYKRQAQADIEKLNAEIKRASHLISSGIEYRKVDVETRYDYKKGIKSRWRTDTGVAIFENIPLSLEERQLELKFKSEAATA